MALQELLLTSRKEEIEVEEEWFGRTKEAVDVIEEIFLSFRGSGEGTMELIETPTPSDGLLDDPPMRVVRWVISL
jgi:hypothetical protein